MEHAKGSVMAVLGAILGFLFWGGLILGAVAMIPWLFFPFLIFAVWTMFGRDPNRSPSQ